MKQLLTIFAFLIFAPLTFSQASSSHVSIVTVHSQDNKFFLKTIPWDNEFPTLPGTTTVFATGKTIPLYTLDRGFDSITPSYNNLVLSNDGEVIFYCIPWAPNEDTDGLKSISIYRHGKLVQSYTASEITGCNLERERCGLLYSNFNAVVDREKSKWGTPDYKRVFKEGTPEQERFLSDFPLVSFNDLVYLVDSKKMVHRFDLKEGTYVGADTLDNVYEVLKKNARPVRMGGQDVEAPIFSEFPKLKNGRDTERGLGDALGMTPVERGGEPDEQYKWYTIVIDCTFYRDGHLRLDRTEIDDELPKEKILEFFQTMKFDTSAIPKVFDQWRDTDQFFYLRKRDNELARQERQLEELEFRNEYQRRMTLDTIDGVHIPASLGEAFTELDKQLPEVDRNEMRALPTRRDMIIYHLNLGMWMRNNWGLHGGSRLKQYFLDHGVRGAEDMSTIVLFFYYDWLTGKKETWKEWEKDPVKWKAFPDQP